MATNPIRILFVDDEAWQATYYLDALRQRFDVQYCDRAEDAVHALRDGKDIRVLIADVMMPPPGNVPHEVVEGGMTTGLWILREVRKEIEERQIAVIVLTNRRVNDVKKAIEGEVYPRTRTSVLFKTDTPAFLLPTKVDGALG